MKKEGRKNNEEGRRNGHELVYASEEKGMSAKDTTALNQSILQFNATVLLQFFRVSAGLFIVFHLIPLLHCTNHEMKGGCGADRFHNNVRAMLLIGTCRPSTVMQYHKPTLPCPTTHRDAP